MPVDVTSSIDMARPGLDVAQPDMDPSNATAWYKNIKSVTLKTPGPVGVEAKIDANTGSMVDPPYVRGTESVESPGHPCRGRTIRGDGQEDSAVVDMRPEVFRFASHGQAVFLLDGTEASQLGSYVLSDFDGARHQNGAKGGGIVNDHLRSGVTPEDRVLGTAPRGGDIESLAVPQKKRWG
jgi:hypothetical protein